MQDNYMENSVMDDREDAVKEQSGNEVLISPELSGGQSTESLIPLEGEEEDDDYDDYVEYVFDDNDVEEVSLRLIWKNGTIEVIRDLDTVEEASQNENIVIYISADAVGGLNDHLVYSNGEESNTVSPDADLSGFIEYMKSYIEILRDKGYNISGILVENPIGLPFGYTIASEDDVILYYETVDGTLNQTLDEIIDEIPRSLEEIVEKGLALVGINLQIFLESVGHMSSGKALAMMANYPLVEILNEYGYIPLKMALGNIFDSLIFGKFSDDYDPKYREILEDRVIELESIHRQISKLRDVAKVYLFLDIAIDSAQRDIVYLDPSENTLLYYGLTPDIIQEYYDGLVVNEIIQMNEKYVLSLDRPSHHKCLTMWNSNHIDGLLIVDYGDEISCVEVLRNAIHNQADKRENS